MSISFLCPDCNQNIIVNHLVPGELAKCKNCKSNVIVPEENIVSENSDVMPNHTNRFNLSIGSLDHNNITIPQVSVVSKPKSYEQQFSTMLLFFSIGLIFHIFEYKIFTFDTKNGNITAVLNLSLIGAFFVIRAGVLAYKLQIYKKIIISLLIVCSLNTIIYFIEMFGQISSYSYMLRILEDIILLILYYKFINKFDIFKEFDRYLTIIITLFICGLILVVVSIVSQTILININRLFGGSDFYLVMFNFFGLMLPIFFIQFVTKLIFTYISFSMYRKYKKVN